MSSNSLLILVILSVIWLGALSFIIVRIYLSNLRLTKHGSRESITQILNDLLKREESNQKIIQQLSDKCAKLERDGLFHIQKIGLVRFNPFKDTGGNQSFILALVDADNTGVIISSLHTRTGARWYAKEVKRGEGVEYELSDEEKKALKGAKHLIEKS